MFVLARRIRHDLGLLPGEPAHHQAGEELNPIARGPRTPILRRVANASRPACSSASTRTAQIEERYRRLPMTGSAYRTTD